MKSKNPQPQSARLEEGATCECCGKNKATMVSICTAAGYNRAWLPLCPTCGTGKGCKYGSPIKHPCSITKLCRTPLHGFATKEEAANFISSARAAQLSKTDLTEAQVPDEKSADCSTAGITRTSSEKKNAAPSNSGFDDALQTEIRIAHEGGFGMSYQSGMDKGARWAAKWKDDEYSRGIRTSNIFRVSRAQTLADVEKLIDARIERLGVDIKRVVKIAPKGSREYAKRQMMGRIFELRHFERKLKDFENGEKEAGR